MNSMYIYNVTSNIDESVHNEWLIWIKDHIAQVLATGRFEKITLIKILAELPSSDITYAVQYQYNSYKTLDTFHNTDIENLVKPATPFADKVLSFKTKLQILNEFSET